MVLQLTIVCQIESHGFPAKTEKRVMQSMFFITFPAAISVQVVRFCHALLLRSSCLLALFASPPCIVIGAARSVLYFFVGVGMPPIKMTTSDMAKIADILVVHFFGGAF